MNGRELSTYSDGTNTISYKYNLNGIRTSKIVNGIKTNYILEGTSIIFEDRNGDMLYYIYNRDELLGFVYKNKTYYYHKNIFGDIIGILNSDYNEIVTYEYDSWGAVLNITDNSGINLDIVNPFRYRSYYYDEETGLYYLNSRYYNPQVGRFINADGVLAGQGINSNNLFMYCGNNPVDRLDILGYGFFSWLKSVFTSSKKSYATVGSAKPYKKIESSAPPKNVLEYAHLRATTPNCYSYAIGKSSSLDPGEISNNTSTKITSNVNVLAKKVKSDLKSEGRGARIIAGPSGAIYDNERRIAMRVTTDNYDDAGNYISLDYHFMVQTDTGQWAEKHGPGGATVLWDSDLIPNDILWTDGINNIGYYDSKIIYMAITD